MSPCGAAKAKSNGGGESVVGDISTTSHWGVWCGCRRGEMPQKPLTRKMQPKPRQQANNSHQRSAESIRSLATSSEPHCSGGRPPQNAFISIGWLTTAAVSHAMLSTHSKFTRTLKKGYEIPPENASIAHLGSITTSFWGKIHFRQSPAGRYTSNLST